MLLVRMNVLEIDYEDSSYVFDEDEQYVIEIMLVVDHEAE